MSVKVQRSSMVFTDPILGPDSSKSFKGIGYYLPGGADIVTGFSGTTANAGDVDSTGRPVMTGALYINGLQYIGVLRLTNAGLPDDTFGVAGWCLIRPTDSAQINSQGFAFQSDGKILVSGVNIDTGGTERALVARVTADGKLDSTFGSGGITQFIPSGSAAISFGVVETPDGHVICTGGTVVSGDAKLFLTRFTSAGAIDTTYAVSGHRVLSLTNSAGWNVRIDTSGRAVVGGQTDQTYATTVASGTGIQNTAGQKELVVTSIGSRPPSGIVAGSFVKVGTGGTLETVLVTGIVGNVLTLADNLAHTHSAAEAVTATYSVIVCARFTVAGALDTTFNTTGYHTVLEGFVSVGLVVCIQSSGRIVVGAAGYLTKPQPVFVAFRDDGALDTTFGDAGVAYLDVLGAPNGLALDPRDRITVGIADNFIENMALRLLPNGQLDMGFGVDGLIGHVAGQPMTPNTTAVASDGTIWLLGAGVPYDSQTYSAVKLTTTGAIRGDENLPVSFTSTASELPAAPASGDSVQAVVGAAERSAWGALTGDGVAKVFPISHNLGTSLVECVGYVSTSQRPSTRVHLASEPDPLDSAAVVLVRFTQPPVAGETVLIKVTA